MKKHEKEPKVIFGRRALFLATTKICKKISWQQNEISLRGAIARRERWTLVSKAAEPTSFSLMHPPNPHTLTPLITHISLVLGIGGGEEGLEENNAEE